ncbi:lipoyl protein ligase domain-containing protein [Gloeothece verrucosa]|uniref:Biotin/lipoate A/B protein ligase n=1 Tax=Gloeothece verrucosa (strain PCC 7822) TaxID=497965 RepID=E0U9I3_GLOV7|nr:biotin/lipoate A/B protein ligase family protein [Gloeothece verrucosa]ADN12675.1 biotin/lipoate A/B protein ligase [Gloeothece verrucosa PCC 7822]
MSTSAPLPWRFIPLMAASGRLQMAVDTWLLEQHLKGNQPSVLRFYRFEPLVISLGFLQRTYPQHWDSLQIERVRRPTGGRAVLHSNDLCYSVITSNIKGKRAEIYQQLCEFLVQGWRDLGLELYYGEAGRGYIHKASCFGTATNADLVDAEGNKFIGSALRCSHEGIIQQGSMQLDTDPNLFQAIFGEAAPKAQFKNVFEDQAFLENIISTLTDAACRCFNIELIAQPLSDEELVKITKIANL